MRGIGNTLTQSKILPCRKLLNVEDWHPQCDSRTGTLGTKPRLLLYHQGVVPDVCRVHTPSGGWGIFSKLGLIPGNEMVTAARGVQVACYYHRRRDLHPNRGSRGSRVAIRSRFEA